ncbi:MAG: type IV secretion system DNA-binding domain-containing protein [bacterium]|nr:type IV secretion system DNA-binding domain-containing protein [bacterium]
MHPDANDPDRRITYFAATHTRGKREIFGIRGDDRGKHVYVIGKTGMGKSTMLENMAIQDIQNGEGIAFIDPHGATAEKLLDFVPHDRVKDVVYFAPFDTENPIGFNVMEDVGYDKRHLVVSGLMGALKRIWVDAWSARMEYILQNTLLALLEYPDSTLLDVNRMLTNKTFRQDVVTKISDPVVRSFWTEEFAAFTDTYTREATPAIQNKIGQFTANPLIRNIVGQARSTFDLRKMMDEKKIFIVNLSKGRMGETNAALLGSMLVVKIYLAAMSRASEPASRMAKLPRCYFYVDEFQSMMNEAFADILSESRKYKLALTLANQYIEQMEENVRDAVFGNIGTLIVFRVGPFDAEVLKTVFEPTFMVEDLVGLGIGQIYLTLMIDGVGSHPFSAETIPPIENPSISYRDDVIENSRAQFSRPRAEIEEVVRKRQTEFVPPPPKPKVRKEYGPPSGPRREGAGEQSGGPRERTNSNDAPHRYPREDYPPRPAPIHAGSPSLGARSPRTSVQAQTATPFRSPNKPEPHSALRAALQNVKNSAAPNFSAIKSPAEIMREQMSMSRNGNIRDEGTNARPIIHAQKPAENSQMNTPNGRDGEVSPDVLRDVIRGRDGIDNK